MLMPAQVWDPAIECALTHFFLVFIPTVPTTVKSKLQAQTGLFLNKDQQVSRAPSQMNESVSQDGTQWVVFLKTPLDSSSHQPGLGTIC